MVKHIAMDDELITKTLPFSEMLYQKHFSEIKSRLLILPGIQDVHADTSRQNLTICFYSAAIDYKKILINLQAIGLEYKIEKVRLLVKGIEQHMDVLVIQKLILHRKEILYFEINELKQWIILHILTGHFNQNEFSALLKMLGYEVYSVEKMEDSGFHANRIKDGKTESFDEKGKNVRKQTPQHNDYRDIRWAKEQDDGQIHKALREEIRELKKTIRSMRLSEEYFRNIFEYSVIGKSITTMDGSFKTNKAFCNLLGYSEKELSRKKWQDITHPDHLESDAKILHSFLSGEYKMHRWEKRYLHKDGYAIWADVSSVLQSDEKGNPLYFITSIQDITEQKKTQEALKGSEVRYRQLFEQNPVPMLIYDTHSLKLLTVNDAFIDHYGYSFSEAMKLKLIDLYPEKEKTAISNLINKLHGHENVGEWHHLKKDGTRFTIEAHSHDIPFEGRKARIAALYDITERKQVESRLRKLNRTYLLLSDINQAIIRVQSMKDLYMTSCKIAVEHGGFRMAWIGLLNPKTNDITPVAFAGEPGQYVNQLRINLDDPKTGKGPTALTLLSGSHTIVNDIENDPRMLPWREEAIRMGYHASASFPLIVTGVLRGVYNLYAPGSYFFDEDEILLLDRMVANIAFAMEFEEEEERRRKAEEEIQVLNAGLEERVVQRTHQLEMANRELEAFSYSVSHDLRAPLRHITGFIELFLEHKATALSEEELGYLTTVTNSANEMGRLIDALLSFSRLNRSELRKTKIDMNQLIHKSISLFKDTIESRSIEIKIGVLPEVYGDMQLMGQVWINLISNAIKYTRKKEHVLIEIDSMIEKQETIFFIRDNGAGFNMKYVDKLFGVFQRLHKSRDFEGIGIGLANIHRIISRHGGRCWAEGEIDKGAVFYFSLPVSEFEVNIDYSV